MSDFDFPVPVPAFQRTLLFAADRNDNDFQIRFEVAAARFAIHQAVGRFSDIDPTEAISKFGGEPTFTKRTPTAVLTLLNFHDAVLAIAVEVPLDQWSISIAADDQTVIDRWLTLLNQVVPPRPNRRSSKVQVHLWTRTPNRTSDCATRWLPRIEWPDIQANYAAELRPALDQLQRLQQPPSNGRLVLLSGSPGTGKTTFLRSLFASWAPWCRAEIVIDPERLFGDPVYMNDVLLRDDSFQLNSRDQPPPWRALVIEDGDEFLLSDAKERVGQGLSRMLGLTDGLLGDGLKVLLVITTNVERHDLHPALVRAGRCIARLDFPTFNTTEAQQWLAHRGQPDRKATDGMTLAELYEAIDPNQLLVGPTPQLVAGYA